MESDGLDIKLHAFLNLHVHTVNISGNKEYTGPTAIQIQFADHIPDFISSSNDLFDTVKLEDTSVFKQFTTKNDVRIYENLPLPLGTTMSEFAKILAFLFGLQINDIRVTPTVKEAGKLTIADRFNVVEYTSSSMTVLGNVTSIGNFSMAVALLKIPTKTDHGYMDDVYGNYSATLSYLKQITAKGKSDLPVHVVVNRIAYRTRIGQELTGNRISLPKLFNSLHVSSLWKKIIIHDDILDDYYQNPFPLQYIKSDIDTKYPFKGTKTTFNTVTVYVNKSIHTGISLTKLDVNKYGDVVHTYSVMDSNLSYEAIKEIVTGYIGSRFMTDIYEKLCLANCFNIPIATEKLILSLENVSGFVSCAIDKKFKIDSLADINIQEIPELRYSTKTSISMNGYSFYNIAMVRMYNDILVTHSTVGEATVKKLALPTIICSNFIENEVIINITNSNSYESLLYNIRLLIAKLNIADSGKNQHSAMTVESITKRCTSIPPKTLLKLLEEIDYKTFGPRYVKNKIRPYSGLSQKANQRVVPISPEEYEILYKERPESVVDIENQTTGGRLCLYCPHKLAPYINFHHSPGEICIPKCTLKQSNKQQFTICAEQLNAANVQKFTTTYENQTIVMYNPLITPGRKCRVPEEFSTLLSGFILLKLSTNDIINYTLKNHEILPYVIQRNLFNQFYMIYTEYDFESDYCLVFRSELDDSYMIVVSETTGEILKFSDNSYITNFFKNNAIKGNSSKNNLFNYIGRLLRINLSEYMNLTTDVLLEKIHTTHKIDFVYSGDYVTGIIHENTFYTTPPLFIKYIDKTSFFTNIYDLYKDDRIEEMCPTISSLNKEYIDEIYKDYMRNKYTLIIFDGVPVMVRPENILDITINTNIQLYDHDSYKYSYLFRFSDVSKVISKDVACYDDISEILIKWLVIFIRKYFHKYTAKEYISEFPAYLKANSVIADTRKIYRTEHGDYVIWTDSKVLDSDVSWFIESVNMVDFTDINTLTDFLNDSMYNQFKKELSFKLLTDSEKLTSKKITI